MGIRDDIAEEQQARDLVEYLDYEIKMAEYNNVSASGLKAIKRQIESPFTDTGNLKHFGD
jgi:hypothetical protein